MNHPRRVRSPIFGYDPRVMNRVDARPPHPGLEYEDAYGPVDPYDQVPAGPPFMEPHSHYPGYRDNRLPSTYRATIRDSYPPSGSAQYKILCITNINPKISDGPVIEALTSDFGHFGDVSVSICHDSGERLAYIYFRTYEEAREARHNKSRSILFDRPIEIEPIYEPPNSPVDSPPPPQLPPTQQIYPRRRSITPSDQYYDFVGPMPHDSQRPPEIMSPLQHHRAMSPPSGYPPASRYMMGPCPSLGPMPYGGRYQMHPSSSMVPPGSPHASPPSEPFRSYHPIPESYSPHPGYSPYPSGYSVRSMMRERDRPPIDPHLSRSPRNDPYYPIDSRTYGQPPPPQHSRPSYSSSIHNHHPGVPPPMMHPSSSSYHPPAGPPRHMSRDYRREKFDGYNAPHDETKPSRVLILNNIDPSKVESDIREIFEPFGIIEDIEVRKISRDASTGLVRYSSMDAAYKAKTATNGRHIGESRCRIIYGKVNSMRRLWIGGLSPSSNLTILEDEVSKYGDITSLDYTSGRPYAYVEYETPNQAQFAAHHLKSTLIAASDRKIRIEFVDSDRGDKLVKPESSSQGSRVTSEAWTANDTDNSPQSMRRKRSASPTDLNNPKKAFHDTGKEDLKSEPILITNSTLLTKARSSSNVSSDGKSVNEKDEFNNNRSETTSTSHKNGSQIKADQDIHQDYMGSMSPDRLIECTSIRDIVHNCSVSWPGQLNLRNFNFSSKLIMCSGRKSTIGKYLVKQNGDIPTLKITQRWRLHPQPKLEEVKRRMQTGNLGMLIIISRPDSSSSVSSPSGKTPQNATPSQNESNGTNSISDMTATDSPATSGGTATRPLRNLISYLEQKDAAGVISLSMQENDTNETPTGSDGSKLLYAFPPGEFALNLLKRLAPRLSPESTKEEFLLGVIVGGIENKI